MVVAWMRPRSGHAAPLTYISRIDQAVEVTFPAGETAQLICPSEGDDRLAMDPRVHRPRHERLHLPAALTWVTPHVRSVASGAGR